ncbi:MAG: patatin-like phospholipase family protein [Myxococcales bacterium]|nr:patatin-like phospholipase family protein [Myxococcales bacterium]
MWLRSGLGLVLAGGAARGAYEAGVLRYLFGEFTRRHRAPWPDVISGTSVGAMNGAFVAARDPAGVDWLAKTWRELQIPQVFGITYTDVFRTLRLAFSDQPFAIADPRPLQRLVARNWPTEAIKRSIAEHGTAWMVGTTDLTSGRTLLFHDGPEAPEWTPRPGVRLVHTRIKPVHALASAALPLLFPPIPLGGAQLVDGGLRQNTPLGPVLRAGADRVLVLSMKRQAMDDERPAAQPNLSFLVGKTLNALLLDPVEQDVFEARNINRIVDWGVRTYGEGFAERLEQDLGVRRAQVLFLTPSEDLGEVAVQLFRSRPPRVSGAVQQLLERAAGSSGPDSDLLSYVYFDREYTGALESLGHEDARRREGEIASVLLGPGG